MSPTPTRHTATYEPGQLLDELEQRQNDVLQQLDALDARIAEVLRGLGASFEEETVA